MNKRLTRKFLLQIEHIIKQLEGRPFNEKNTKQLQMLCNHFTQGTGWNVIIQDKFFEGRSIDYNLLSDNEMAACEGMARSLTRIMFNHDKEEE